MWFRPSSACKTTSNHSPGRDRSRSRTPWLHDHDQELAVEALTEASSTKSCIPISTLKTAARDRNRPLSSNSCAACSICTMKPRKLREVNRGQEDKTDGSPAHRLPRLTTCPLAGHHISDCCARKATPSNWRSSRPPAIKSLTLLLPRSAPRACSPRRSKRRCSKTALT